MKPILFLVPLMALVLAPATAVATVYGHSIQGGMQATGLDTISRADPAAFRQERMKLHALYALREEGLRLRVEDGGTLTARHRDYLQAKLDAIEGRRH